MKSDKSIHKSEAPDVLRAKLRIGLLMLLLFVIYIIEAYLAFPFVDHTTSAQNVGYGFVVTAPFYVTVIIFILVIRKGLTSSTKK